MNKIKKKSRFPYFLQEITIVVIGVLIAVSIGNYKENLDNKRYINKTLSAIENEIELSKSDLDTILDKHIEMYSALEDQIDHTDKSIGELIGSLGGFQVASIKNVSLRFFVANKAELLDFELISKLLEIERHADLLSDKIDILADFAYESVNDRGEEAKLRFTYLLVNVIDTEQTLLEAYTIFLDENESFLDAEK